MQQGDPLGPILFTLAVDPAIQTLRSSLNLWFLDDCTLAGPMEIVTAYLHNIFLTFRELGLEINQQKCEITRLDRQ